MNGNCVKLQVLQKACQSVRIREVKSSKGNRGEARESKRKQRKTNERLGNVKVPCYANSLTVVTIVRFQKALET